MLAIFVATVQAQAAPQPTTKSGSVNDEVIVIGTRESYKLNTRALRAARLAFLEHRKQFAPKSSLFFRVEGREGKPLPAKRIRLQFTDGTNTVGVPIDVDNSFNLDGLPSGDWWLESNLSRRDVKIEPLTLSPLSSRYDYRLGDGRLQCRVSWAMLKASASLLAAPLVGAVGAIGPCTTRKVGIYVTTPAPIRGAVLTEKGRSVPVDVVKHRHLYRYPGGDKTFSDEARVTVTLAQVKMP